MSDSWLLQPVGTPGKRRRRNFIERTLNGISATVEQSVFAEELARTSAPVQRLDPRVKLVGFLVLLVAVSLVHTLPALAVLYISTLVIARFSAIPLAYFVRRIWLTLPFFTAALAIPVLLNIVTPGETALPLPGGLAITWSGIHTSARLVLRVATSFSFATLLILTTPWVRILHALRVFRVPRIFVMILGMTYRYIYLLLHIANNMFLSRKSRVIGPLSQGESRRWTGAASVTLLHRSIQLSNDVYLAMLSRGYRGEAHTMEEQTLQLRDWLWLLLVTGGAMSIVLTERILRGY